MDEAYFKKITSTILVVVLIIISFLVIKPILMAIIMGLILAFIFNPIYEWVYRKTKSPNLSATLISIFLALLILLPIWFLTPIMIDQSLKAYFSVQEIDFVGPLKSIFPSIFASEAFAQDVGTIIQSFVTKSINSLTGAFANLISEFPKLLLQLLVVLFTFYFVLRDKEELINYIKSLLPFSKDVERKLFNQTRGITFSVLYGQVVVGILQGLIAGAGFFLFGVTNALVLTILAAIVGIFPIIGPALVWIPVMIYSLAVGNTFQALGVTVFGLVASTIDNILRPLIVSQRTSMPPSLVLIGMIGGFFFLGILGFILGPLILAYLLIILEIYRNKRVPGLLVQEPPQKLKINL